MYEKQTLEEVMSKCVNAKEMNIANTRLIVDIFSGEMYRRMKTGNWKKIENKVNHGKGYNVILIEKKQYTRAKLILCASGAINIQQKYINIHHVNGNRLDCSIGNLNCVYSTTSCAKERKETKKA